MDPEETHDLSRPDSALVGAVLPSPNHNARLRPLDSILLHYTGMANGPVATAWLRNPASNVSSHYVIEEGGRILQLVAEDRRAWHAGRSFWRGETDMNSTSIGIEIVNDGHAGDLPPYPDVQIEAVIALCRDIKQRHGIRRDRVIGHSDVAPARKQDPGERFPWDRLHSAGLGLWVPPQAATEGPSLKRGDEGEAVAGLQRALGDLGFESAPTGVFDQNLEVIVRAFQRHYRPAVVDGMADWATRATLDDLLLARAALAS